MPPLPKRKFEFELDPAEEGEEKQKVVWEYTPLTQSQVEEARAAVRAPTPPTRRVEGGAEDLIAKKRQGYPIHEPDWDDPEYKAAVERYNTDLSLEMCRLALGWEMDREVFAREMRSRVPAGVVQSLINAVAASTWRLDQIDRFLGTSSP